MDQTTAIILAALVTGIFTLGASILVTILANKQAVKLEQLRQQEAQQTTMTGRKTKAIEDVFEGLLNIESICESLAYGRTRPDSVGLGQERFKEIKGILVRLETLIHLYLPKLQRDFDDYQHKLNGYLNAFAQSPPLPFGLARQAEDQGKTKAQAESVEETKKAYHERLHMLQQNLKEQVC
jgi:hypothetical protein